MIKMIKKIYSVAGTQKKNITKMLIAHIVKGLFEGVSLGALLYFLLKICQQVFEKKAIIISDIYIVAGIAIAGFIGKMIFGHISNCARSVASYTLGGNSRLRIGDRLKNVNMGYFSDKSLGEVSSGLTTVITAVETIGVFIIETMTAGFIETAIMAIFIIPFDFITAIIILISVALTLFVNRFSQVAGDIKSARLQELKINLNARVLEFINGMAVVKSFGSGKEILNSVEKSIDENKKGFFALEKIAIPANFLFAIILRIGGVAIIISALLRYSAGTIEGSKAIMLTVISFVVFAGFEIALGLLTIKQMVMTSLNKMTELEEIQKIEEGAKTELDNASLEIKNVDFSYLDDETELFKNLSLTIPENKTTALVGTSGCGKTTVCNLLARFWDVQNGEVLVGGINVKNYKYDSLLANFSFVFQDVYLFDDTVKNNLKFGNPNATDQEIIEAAKKSRCHDFIMQLPNGYDTEIQEGGSNFSGGEKQRLSIARAMLKPSKIVILDEATSSVDPETESELILALNELLQNKTVIVIAHRLRTIRNADNIIVMDKGKIIQQGTHTNLMQQNGMYKNFVEMREQTASWKM